MIRCINLTSCLLLAVTAMPPLSDTRAAELVMVERPGCPVCLRWRREIGPVYPKTLEARHAPLRHLDIGASGTLALAEPVRYTPTFVLIDGDREVGRITGYTSDDAFWGLLGELLTRLKGAAPSP